MARQFEIPTFYKSPIISQVKKARQMQDRLKRDLSPAVLDFGPVRFVLARHFGFCFGVENAIEIAYRTLEAYPDRRIFFLSEMIHNPNVNRDLQERGVRFIFEPSGEQRVGWETLTPEDLVVVPAFGTTLEVQKELMDRGIDPMPTIRPVRLWRRCGTEAPGWVMRATRWWCTARRPTRRPGNILTQHPGCADGGGAGRGRGPPPGRYDWGEAGQEAFFERFGHKCSSGFDPDRDLQRIGVVNQTTMLAPETGRSRRCCGRRWSIAMERRT